MPRSKTAKNGRLMHHQKGNKAPVQSPRTGARSTHPPEPPSVVERLLALEELRATTATDISDLGMRVWALEIALGLNRPTA